MKKVLLSLLFVVGILVAFSSCKKEYNCTCTDLFDGTVRETTSKGKDATDACQDAVTKILLIPQETCIESTAK